MWLNHPLQRIMLATLLVSAGLRAQPHYPDLGRLATPTEIKAWDIDVRADFKGLPVGRGSAAKGSELWENKCASCHGVFGESNQVFPPLVGGTTASDMAQGRVAAMTNGTAPYRTTLMKVSQVSTLWDYINRAMPWNAPKSLSTDEVYAVTAYLLNLGGIVADDFVLSQDTIAAVQASLPNRNGKTMQHGLWHVQGKPDVNAIACVKHCGNGRVSSALPDYARNAHGNLAEQNRSYGPYRGIDTTQAPSLEPITSRITTSMPISRVTPMATSMTAVPASMLLAHEARPTPPSSINTAATSTTAAAGTLATTVTAKTVSPPPTASAAQINALLNTHNCTACHGMTQKIVGPALSAITKKYASQPNAAAYLAEKITAGSQNVWGTIPMPAQTLPAQDIARIVQWLMQPQ